MMKHVFGMIAVCSLFVGAMALPRLEGATQARFVPYHGPYRTVPPAPPKALDEEVPKHGQRFVWVSGHWVWTGEGYRWSSGRLVRRV